MRLLLTWSDRTLGRKRGQLPAGHAGHAGHASHAGHAAHDPGPILRLLTASQVHYDTAVVLTPRRTRAGAQALAREIRAYVDEVDIQIFDVPDPSDHARLFAIMGEVLPTLPQAENGQDVKIDVLLSAGTPQAQTLWLILVQAGLLKARMLQVIPPAFVPHPHPEPIREVRLDIEGFPEIRALRDEVVRLRARVATVAGDLVGESPPMRRLADVIGRIANARVSTLILGETGTGKELVARAIHAASARANAPFVAENCGAFDEGVLSSELFGHEPGAFTGAMGRRRGLFEQAHGGTLFLDEVGELTLAVQVRLLRVLQEGVIRRLGGEASIPVDVRIIAATHRDLRALIANGQFREDVYYRLRGAEVHVPALRERLNDLDRLIMSFLRAEDRPELRLTRRAWQLLECYAWPGNVRELQAEVRRWTVFCDESVDVDDLAPEIREASQQSLPSRILSPHTVLSRLPVQSSLADSVAEAERRAITAALSASDGNLSATARVLAIDRNTLKRKMAKYGLR